MFLKAVQIISWDGSMETKFIKKFVPVSHSKIVLKEEISLVLAVIFAQKTPVWRCCATIMMPSLDSTNCVMPPKELRIY